MKKLYAMFVGIMMLVSSIHAGPHLNVLEEKHFVIVCASYNNKDWYRWNLDSLINQDYKNYHIMYIDDFSTDGTGALVAKYIQENKETRFNV